ncbi:8'-apo-carotenoid 13,14-cleaving dioxygenase [Sphingorhabdus sp. 109]|jgi:carotenoid cleavage dioxygenase|uniref:8'-apo-carotenoid 13,14-cleaving dioxygenase n=1 Tax=Sphingorhabdus sp. 109 TaxID=2653173 RepID=UPI0012F1613C|nr:carotenoid oxygenase family protein [Sphingorhabdus sp. 109]VWX59941.1 8'-apo-carotenoid 13,14-cleaving dioxygenase [Sphingorhabdus sp. 109]
MASVIEKTIRAAVTPVMGAVSNFNRKRLDAPEDGHPYLTGVHKPMTEEVTLADLPVEGKIPAALDGRYLRIGPNPVDTPDEASYHWFAGDGMAHGVRISGGKAEWYRNRWIRSNKVSDALGEARKPGTRKPRTDNANTNIIGINGRTFAIVEAGGFPVEMSAELDTIAHNPFDNSLNHAFSAHPHLDPATGEMHAICYDAPVMDKVWHVVLGKEGKVRREEPIPVRQGPSIHDCQITDNHVLVFDLPATFSMKRMLAGYAFPYDWNPEHGARVGLCPREGLGMETIWCELDEPCYVYHPANAFETADGTVIVDVVVHESTYARSTFGPGGKWSRLERWTVDPASRKVDRKILDDRPQEFPRYDERKTMQPYRFIYDIALAGHPDELDMAGTELFKHDLQDGSKLVRDFGPGRHPGEFVFVPRAPDAAEDEGWLIGLVIDAQQEKSELQILNADDFLGEPQAVIHLPHRIPPGFHGNWVAG